MRSDPKWDKEIQKSLLDCFGSGAISFAYIVGYILANGANLTRKSLSEILQSSLDSAKLQGNADYYSEILLASHFFDNLLSEIDSESKE